MKSDLYRHFDRDGNLLYVGVSLNVVQRMIAHLYHSSWYDEISTITIEKFSCRHAAEIAEEAAIREEGPRYNKRMQRKLGDLRRFDPSSMPDLSMDEYLIHWRASGSSK